MGGTDFSILNKTLGEMLARASNIEKPLKEIGLMMVGEQQKNIISGGRPDKWEPSIRVKVGGGETLRLTGHLMNALTFGVEGPRVAAGPGSAVSKYARILALGGTIKAKSKKYLKFFIPGVGWIQKKEVTIKARDYTYMPPDTSMTFGEVVGRFVMG
jgi:phage gpG-like protein